MTWRAFITLLCTLIGLRGGQASDLPVVREGVTRRAFLTALGVSVGALATAPFELDVPLLLDEPITGNQFVMADWIAKEALRILEKNLTFSRTINREYGARFGATIDARLPARYRR